MSCFFLAFRINNPKINMHIIQTFGPSPEPFFIKNCNHNIIIVQINYIPVPCTFYQLLDHFLSTTLVQVKKKPPALFTQKQREIFAHNKMRKIFIADNRRQETATFILHRYVDYEHFKDHCNVERLMQIALTRFTLESNFTLMIRNFDKLT